MKFTTPTPTHDYKPLSKFSNGDIVEFKCNPSVYFLIIIANPSIDNVLADMRGQDRKDQIHLLHMKLNQIDWEKPTTLARKIDYKLELLP
jgi:hypothetical protein